MERVLDVIDIDLYRVLWYNKTMRKHYTIILLIILAFLALLFLPSLFDAVFAFIFVGVIPFTNTTIPPVIMMPIYSALIILGVYHLTKQSSITASPAKREEAGRKRARKKVYKQTNTRKSTTKTARPKKRYQTATGN